jgi:hypothetical protein
MSFVRKSDKTCVVEYIRNSRGLKYNFQRPVESWLLLKLENSPNRVKPGAFVCERPFYLD